MTFAFYSGQIGWPPFTATSGHLGLSLLQLLFLEFSVLANLVPHDPAAMVTPDQPSCFAAGFIPNTVCAPEIVRVSVRALSKPLLRCGFDRLMSPARRQPASIVQRGAMGCSPHIHISYDDNE